MLIYLLVAWAIVVPVLVVSGLYVVSGFLARRVGAAGGLDVSWLPDELLTMWEQQPVSEAHAVTPTAAVAPLLGH